MNEKVGRFFKALSHPLRIEIVKQLYDGATCVCNINNNIKSSQANISKHLKILKESGVLQSEKVGMFQYYRLSDEKVKEIVDLVEKIVK